MITPITATFPALNFPKEVDYPTQEDWAEFSAEAELNYGILSGEWSDKSEEFKAQANNLAQEIQDIGENAINAITFDNIAQLKLNSNMGRVDVLGYYTKGDGGGGIFYWDSTSTESDNAGTIIQATGIATGRWKRVFSGAVNVKWFGAKGDGVTNDSVAIQTAINLFTKIFAPRGHYVISSTLEFKLKNTMFFGENSNYMQNTLNTVFIPTDEMTGSLFLQPLQHGGCSLSNFTIYAETSNISNCIYIKDTGGSLNYGNTIENVSIRKMKLLGACGIRCEGWGTLIKNVYITEILKGNGVFLGAGGSTGTTQILDRVYCNQCDICISIAGTQLGVSINDCILESSPVAIWGDSNHITINNLYLENINCKNYLDTGVYSCQDSTVNSALHFTHWLGTPTVDFSSRINIAGLQLTSMSIDAVYLLSVSSVSNVSFFGGDFKNITSDKIKVYSGSKVSFFSPKRLPSELNYKYQIYIDKHTFKSTKVSVPVGSTSDIVSINEGNNGFWSIDFFVYSGNVYVEKHNCIIENIAGSGRSIKDIFIANSGDTKRATFSIDYVSSLVVIKAANNYTYPIEIYPAKPEFINI